MKPLLTLVLVVLIGGGAWWFLTQPKGKATAEDVRDSVRETADKVGQNLKDTFDTDKIKDELSRTGKVVREKTRKAGEAIADATVNARVTATIKTKLIKDPTLTALKIDVDTTDGLVTLSGTAGSHEEIARAMALALDTEGVFKVVSTLQIKP